MLAVFETACAIDAQGAEFNEPNVPSSEIRAPAVADSFARK